MFAEDLKAKLKENHMTQKELAEYLNVSHQSVSNWCRGKVPPKNREFDMICDLFEMSRERYTAERSGIPEVPFTPKPYVDPKVKEKVDLSENPYRKAPVIQVEEVEAPEEPFRCDLEIKQCRADYEVLAERLETAVKRWKDAEEQITVLTRQVERLENNAHMIEITKRRLEEMNDKINYMRGMLDGSRPQELVSGVEEQKSWWKRLWE